VRKVKLVSSLSLLFLKTGCWEEKRKSNSLTYIGYFVFM
jgi:hypothetical protein